MGQLQNVKHSALDYFIFAVLDKLERRELVTFAFKHFKPQEHFVWGPRKILSGQVAHCKNENMDQPTENNCSSAEDQQKRVNKMDASHPPQEMQSKKDHKNKEPVIPNKLTETTSENDGLVKKKKHDLSVGVNDDGDDNENIPNKLTETNSDQFANKSRQCSSENGDASMENYEIGVGGGVGDGDSVSGDNENIAPTNKSHGHDAVSGSHQTEEESSSQVHDDKIEDKESEDNQKRLYPYESKNENEKIEASLSPEGMNSKKDHQHKNELVIPNNLTEGHSVSVSGDNENTAPENMAHAHDAASGSHQTEEESSCQVHDKEIEDKESEDNQKRLYPYESENEKIEASLSPEGMNSKKDHQHKNELVIPNNLTEGHSVSVSGDNENTAPENMAHAHDAASGSHQTEEESSCQVHDKEIEDKESEDNQKRLYPYESENEKIEASLSPEGMNSKKDHQHKNEPVIPNNLTEGHSVSVSGDNENTAPENMAHAHDAASGSHQTEEESSCKVHEEQIKDETK